MIRSKPIVVGVEAKDRGPTSKTVSDWLGENETTNKQLVLDGWIDLINDAVGCRLTNDSVADVDYQLLSRTASACSLKAKRFAVVYQYFIVEKDGRPAGRNHSEFYRNQLRQFARLVGSRRLAFLFYSITAHKTQEFVGLERQWKETRPTPRDLSTQLKEMLVENRVAVFDEPVITHL